VCHIHGRSYAVCTSFYTDLSTEINIHSHTRGPGQEFRHTFSHGCEFLLPSVLKQFLKVGHDYFLHVFSHWNCSLINFNFPGVEWDWVCLVRRPLSDLLYQPRMKMSMEHLMARGNGSTRGKPSSVPHFPPHTPYYLTWNRTQEAAVGSRPLTAWALARPALSFDALSCVNAKRNLKTNQESFYISS
jgi:hypothetical protein